MILEEKLLQNGQLRVSFIQSYNNYYSLSDKRWIIINMFLLTYYYLNQKLQLDTKAKEYYILYYSNTIPLPFSVVDIDLFYLHSLLFNYMGDV